MPKSVNAVAAVALLFLASSCAGTVTIKSRKTAGFDKKLQRVLIAIKPGRLSPDVEAALGTGLVTALQPRGVAARLAVVAGELTVKDPPSLEAQAKDFRASAILLLLPDGGLVDQYGNLLRAKYDGQLFDGSSQKRVWRAAIEWAQGGTALSAQSRADVAIRELLAALTADGLIAPPPAPPAPAARGATAARGPTPARAPAAAAAPATAPAR